MYAILNEKVALRSWKDLPCAFLYESPCNARKIRKESFERLLLADGSTEMPEDELQQRLIKKGYLTACEKGEKQLSEWQKLIVYSTMHKEVVKIAITGKCNYNCVHCFNAVDNAPLHTELSLEQILQILDEAKAEGIFAVNLTGGEPMLHPAFDQILEEIHERGMQLQALTTNGAFFTGPVLQKIKQYNPAVEIRISFDGIGTHDWMRGVKGAQEQALQALKLCRENKLSTKVHLNMNRRTLPSIPETLEMLDELGVDTCVVARTIETPRAVLKCAGELLTIPEYFDEALKIAGEYIGKPHGMELCFWHFISLDPVNKTYHLTPGSRDRAYDPSRFICPVCHFELAIDSTGDVYPCMQCSGKFQELGLHPGNVFRDGIRKLLQEGPYLDAVNLTGKDRIDACEKCRNCPHVGYCKGGCPALTLGNPDTDCSLLGYNMICCPYFEGGYDLKIREALEGYKEESADFGGKKCN